jgi:hypothetical protein
VTISRFTRFGCACWLLLSAGLHAACSDPASPSEPEPPKMNPIPVQCTNLVQNTTESDVDCGGTECERCTVGRKCVRANDCASGQCVDNICQDPSCGNERIDSGESDTDCGGKRCRRCAADQRCKIDDDCTSGVCKDGICAAPSCDDGLRNGDEQDVDCGAEGCAGCRAGTACTSGAQCASGVCAGNLCEVSCAIGSAECDGDLNVECEVTTTSDAQNCGACGAVCALEHAEAVCSESVCAIATCEASYADCNGKAADGCEANLNRDADHCGDCDQVCPREHAEPSCVQGICAITCDFGFGDCDRDVSNGCETVLDDNIEHCGGCNRRCAAPAGETAFCSNGVCGRTG